MSTIATDRGLTVRQAGERIGVGERTVWRLIEIGELPSFKVGKARRLLASSVDDFVARQLAADVAVRAGRPA
jgi:excisionase family DNA binding protein